MQYLNSHKYSNHFLHFICKFFGFHLQSYIAVCLKSTNIILISISDVFLEKERAKKLVELCNKNNLELIHLKEVVEDAVG